MRVAILGVGEIIGLEECASEEMLVRKTTVVCNQNDSVIYFISKQVSEIWGLLM
jgi:hypothetical protein